MGDLVLYLNSPGMETREVHTTPYSTVQSLEAFLPDMPPHLFYFEGFELSPAFSLAFSGVSDNGVITAIPSVREEAPRSLRPTKMGTDKPPPKLVSDRLTDQFFQHIEGTTSSYRKLITRFLHMGSKRPKKKTHNPTVIPQVPVGPATDELPCEW
jgi:hypothetical protein